MKIVEKIKLLRVQRKISREKLAAELFISPGTYRDIENSKIRLSLDNFLIICKVLQVSPMELLKNSDDEHFILLDDNDISDLNRLVTKINKQCQNIDIRDNHGNIIISQKD